MIEAISWLDKCVFLSLYKLDKCSKNIKDLYLDTFEPAILFYYNLLESFFIEHKMTGKCLYVFVGNPKYKGKYYRSTVSEHNDKISKEYLSKVDEKSREEFFSSIGELRLTLEEDIRNFEQSAAIYYLGSSDKKDFESSIKGIIERNNVYKIFK